MIGRAMTIGPQYRSAIFYHTDEQKRLAEHYKQKLDAAGLFPAPIVTEIVPFTEFYRAEAYHQNYLQPELDPAILPGHHQAEDGQDEKGVFGQAEEHRGGIRCRPGGLPVVEKLNAPASDRADDAAGRRRRNTPSAISKAGASNRFRGSSTPPRKPARR